MTSGKRPALTLFTTLIMILTQFLLLSSLLAQTAPAAKPAAESALPLREGWAIQTSTDVKDKGEVISTAKFVTKGWHEATVPTTVVAALVKDKTFPDPLFGTNLRQYPGMNYPIGANFSDIAMAADSPYAVSWWYRKQF